MSAPIIDSETKGALNAKAGDGYQPSLESMPVSTGKGDILSLEHTDPVLNAKMHLINDVRASSAASHRGTLHGRSDPIGSTTD